MSDHRLEKNASGDKENLSAPQPMILRARSRAITFPRRPLLMGILDISGDSFFGAGRLDSVQALARAAEMVAEGADIVDVGTECAAISEDEEWSRLRPFLEGFESAISHSHSHSHSHCRPRDADQLYPPLLSVNTWHPSIAARALEAGCDLLSVGGSLLDAPNARLCAAKGTAILIAHSRGEQKISLATGAGISADHILICPGTVFSTQAAGGLSTFRELCRLHRFGRPILLPVSRKGVTGLVPGMKAPADREAGTVACIVAGSLRGASLFRVHDVPAAWQTLRTIEAVKP